MGLALIGCGDPAGEAVERGDRLLAEGALDAAVAEYRLALRQVRSSPELHLRLAHAYARSGDVDRSVREYEALLERDSAYRWQAAVDLGEAARGALRRGAMETMARALDPLASVGPGSIPRDLRLALARHRAREGGHELALPLYLSVLWELEAAESGPEDPELVLRLVFEVGRSYEELGGCVEAIPWFDRFLARADDELEAELGVRWHLGHCLFVAAEADRGAGQPRAALARLDRLVELGVPRTLLDRAHFLRGELLLGLGRPEDALEAYREVLRLHPSRSGYLARRTEERIRDVRFGFRDP